MPNVIFVVGLPGSGKSHYAKALAKQTESELFDDYKSNAIGNCSRFPFGRNYIELVNYLRKDTDCVVSDIDFCDDFARNEAQLCLQELIPNIKIRWIFFENNPDQCKYNVGLRAKQIHRDIDSEINNIDRYSRNYHILIGSEIIPVWK